MKLKKSFAITINMFARIRIPHRIIFAVQQVFLQLEFYKQLSHAAAAAATTAMRLFLGLVGWWLVCDLLRVRMYSVVGA